MKLKHTALAVATLHAVIAWLQLGSDPEGAVFFIVLGIGWVAAAVQIMFYDYYASHKTPYCDDIEEECARRE